MEILFLMVPLGIVLVGVGVWAFFWAVGSGQFDDLDSPGWSVLGDDDELRPPPGNVPPATDSTNSQPPPTA